MDNMNIKIDLTQPEKPNPIHLLTASLKYLMAYTKALTKEYDLPEDDVCAAAPGGHHGNMGFRGGIGVGFRDGTGPGGGNP